jgi:hypothetical protein
MASTEPKISKQAVDGATRDMILIIVEKLEIVWRPGSATSHHIIMAAYRIGLLTT